MADRKAMPRAYKAAPALIMCLNCPTCSVAVYEEAPEVYSYGTMRSKQKQRYLAQVCGIDPSLLKRFAVALLDKSVAVAKLIARTLVPLGCRW